MSVCTVLYCACHCTHYFELAGVSVGRPVVDPLPSAVPSLRELSSSPVLLALQPSTCNRMQYNTVPTAIQYCAHCSTILCALQYCMPLAEACRAKGLLLSFWLCNTHTQPHATQPSKCLQPSTHNHMRCNQAPKHKQPYRALASSAQWQGVSPGCLPSGCALVCGRWCPRTQRQPG